MRRERASIFDAACARRSIDGRVHTIGFHRFRTTAFLVEYWGSAARALPVSFSGPQFLFTYTRGYAYVWISTYVLV